MLPRMGRARDRNRPFGRSAHREGAGRQERDFLPLLLRQCPGAARTQGHGAVDAGSAAIHLGQIRRPRRAAGAFAEVRKPVAADGSRNRDRRHPQVSRRSAAVLAFAALRLRHLSVPRQALAAIARRTGLRGDTGLRAARRGDAGALDHPRGQAASQRGDRPIIRLFRADAFLDGHYCVPEEGSANTKRIFGLLAQLLALQTSAADLAITPTVHTVQ